MQCAYREEDEMSNEDYSETAYQVRTARAALEVGANRDDVYHAIVRYAAQTKQDRYKLWQQVVSEGL